ncbi:MAG: hypothetical protein ACPKPY_07920 [Nitrososphaeraceae archaeon]
MNFDDYLLDIGLAIASTAYVTIKSELFALWNTTASATKFSDPT